MKRYSIMGRQYQGRGEVELCQCDAHPEDIAAAAREKRLLIKTKPGGRKVRVPLYEHVYVIDHEARPPRTRATAVRLRG